MKNIIVSIVCVTYKHDKFLKQAIESFLSQKTKFNFEIIIAEDCSPDNSKKIIEEYRKNNFDKIRPLYQKKHKGMMKNYIEALEMVRGEYVAICDGDDYWTDPNKLQKQYDFLSKNKDFNVCSHYTKMFFEDKSQPDILTSPYDYVSEKTKKRGYLLFEDLFPVNGLSSSSVMYRWKINKVPKWLYRCSGGDLFLHLVHSDLGKIGVIKKSMSVYRRHSGGVFWKNDTLSHQLKNYKKYLFLLKNVDKYLNYRHHDVILKTINNVIKEYSFVKINKTLPYKIFIITKRTIKFFTKPVSFKEKVDESINKIKLFSVAIQHFFVTKKKHTDLLIIDDQFPQETPLGFRNAEYTYYLKYFNKDIKIITKKVSPPDMSGKDFFNYYKGVYNSKPVCANFLEKTELQNINKKYTAKLGYTIFESQAFINLNFFEKNQIPFIFTLYPGGMFEINNKDSVYRKKRIFASKYFRKVIVTQKITKDYLIKNNLCEEQKIEYIPIGISQIKRKQVKSKKYYHYDKKSLDVCFVAFNYGNTQSKGYDVLIKTINEVNKYKLNINFHIVGNWNFNDKKIKKYVNKNVFYYGIKPPSFFPNFYSKMDIFISLSKKQKKGSFDGFPLGIEAGYCGVALIASDVMKQNNLFTNNKDIIITTINSHEICHKILELYKNPKKLRSISNKGKFKFHKYVDIEYQCQKRMLLFNKEISKIV